MTRKVVRITIPIGVCRYSYRINSVFSNGDMYFVVEKKTIGSNWRSVFFESNDELTGLPIITDKCESYKDAIDILNEEELNDGKPINYKGYKIHKSKSPVFFKSEYKITVPFKWKFWAGDLKKIPTHQDITFLTIDGAMSYIDTVILNQL